MNEKQIEAVARAICKERTIREMGNRTGGIVLQEVVRTIDRQWLVHVTEAEAAIRAAFTPLPIEDAPKNGDLLLLKVDYSGAYDYHPLEDSEAPSLTIGFNNFEKDGEDMFRFAGWDWSDDYFTEGTGTAVGYIPLPEQDT